MLDLHARDRRSLRTKSPEEVLRFFEQDPSVKAGLEAVKTVTYTFPKGMLAFPLARPDRR